MTQVTARYEGIDVVLGSLETEYVIVSTSPWNTAVPPTTRHSAYNSLQLQTSQFMTFWKVMSVPPDSTTFCVQVFADANVTVHDSSGKQCRWTPDSATFALKSLRIQTPQFMTLWKVMPLTPDSTTFSNVTGAIQHLTTILPGMARSVA